METTSGHTWVTTSDQPPEYRQGPHLEDHQGPHLEEHVQGAASERALGIGIVLSPRLYLALLQAPSRSAVLESKAPGPEPEHIRGSTAGGAGKPQPEERAGAQGGQCHSGPEGSGARSGMRARAWPEITVVLPKPTPVRKCPIPASENRPAQGPTSS